MSPESHTPSPLPEKNSEQIKQSFNGLLGGITEFLRDLFNLTEGLDREGTIIEIKTSKRMRGANAWLLICSIMVASLGLDLNSPAVIIGAMLISPLMSPILGVGLSVGVNDRDMLSISLRHFTISIVIALLTSFIYFKLTPLGEITPEIRARTAPTFLDVLVAFFGGVAGIISGSRKNKSNAIPGVAIATALMPPLCVTGFGLAKQEWTIMVNSFYLFFLNAVFVALATYLIVRLLNFPHKTFINPQEKNRTRLLIFLFSIILIAPSVFILSGVLRHLNEKQRIETFFQKNFPDALWEMTENTQNDSMKVKLFLFDPMEDDSLDYYKNQFGKLDSRADLNVIQSIIPREDINLEDLQKSVRTEVLSLIETETKIKDERQKKIQQLQSQLDSLRSDTVQFRSLVKEAKVLFPDLEELGFARMQATDFDTSLTQVPTLLVSWKKGKNSYSKKRDEEKLAQYCRLRVGLDTLIIIHR